MSAGAIFILVVVASFPTLILVALVVKLSEVRQAKRWPATPGKVLLSQVTSVRKKPGDAGYNFGDGEVTNEPLVEYEYQVEGKSYRNRRITIGEKTGGHELEGILARYPVGATVTVYYNPAHPQTAVLERDIFNSTMWAGLGCLMLLFIGGPLLAAFLYFNGVEWLKPYLADPKQAPFVAAAGGFGLLVLLFAIGVTGIVWKARRWPTTPGRIVSADVEEYLATDSNQRLRTQYKSSVVYAYEVNGRRYQGDRVNLGITISATVPGLAQRTANKYPVGRAVTVYYNPENPGEAVLHPHSWLHYFPWLIAALMFTLVWAIATGRLG